MKNKLKLVAQILAVSAIILFFSQCNDKEPVGPQTSEFATEFTSGKAFLENNAPVAQKFTKDADSWITITSSGNLRYTIPSGSLYLGGSPVTGNVDIEITEYLSRADMIFGGITTSTSTQLLESDGMFKIEISQGGQPLTLLGWYSVNIPSNDFDSDMLVFEGEETTNVNGDEEITWVEQRDSSWVQQGEDTTLSGGGGYRLTLDFLSWCNLDKYYDQQPQTQVRLKVPANYTNSNTTVYMIMDDNSVTNLYGDVTNQEFNSGSYTAPIGWDVKFLVVGVIDGELMYALKDSEITNPHLETITTMTPISEADLEAIIQAL